MSKKADIFAIAKVIDPRPFQVPHCFTREKIRRGAEEVALQRARIVMGMLGVEQEFFDDDIGF